MIIHRKANERGHADFGWLDSHHSFSFGQYYDPKHLGFGALRVINDDRVAAGGGFDTHGHKDMEIVSYVLEGALAHRDSLGSGSVIRPGDVQVMSAGTGIRHSEFNASKADPVHFLQIWIIPEKQGLKPNYAEKHFPEAERLGQLRLIASPDGRDGSLTIRQDASIRAAVLDAGTELTHPLAEGRRYWLQVAKGALDVNGKTVLEGDGLAIVKETSLTLRATSRSEILIFDLQ
ncbi:pirin family protein [Aestuariivirga sp. YIM B02566]|uniref:Pirin family protein n=1 Tax=Taklimakanibacter albus TaxID=2800327 RepID=A0ACC5RDK8_9HYPH|nr:pirin family protein [Aestuariivirga sp. YIM B02566]MBK1870791.1 pirin family protein [Aestuariivirga sp. YIM B02566]